MKDGNYLLNIYIYIGDLVYKNPIGEISLTTGDAKNPNISYSGSVPVVHRPTNIPHNNIKILSGGCRQILRVKVHASRPCPHDFLLPNRF